MNVGDKVSKQLCYGDAGGTLLGPERGVITYIHPSGRWYLAEFKVGSGIIRETFHTLELTDTAVPEYHADGVYLKTVKRHPKGHYIGEGLSPRYIKSKK